MYIDQTVRIPYPLPENLRTIILELEESDKNTPELYLDIADELSINAKNAYAAGAISKKTQKLLEKKYISRALRIASAEDICMTKIYDFSKLPVSDRNGSYGGNSGDKEGVILDGRYWLLKYPKSTKTFSNVGSLSYTTSPLSEYIGSHIYEILGYDVHKTLLGIRNEQVVVACQDMCDSAHRLIEFRQLKNTYNRKLSEELDTTLQSTEDNHFVNLRELQIHLEYNPELQNVEGLKDRFWDCIIIDGFINNNDRNSGNWGLLRSKMDRLLAPVYDNGNAFSPNIPESRIRRKLDDIKMLRNGALHGKTAYSLDGERNALFSELLDANIPELNEALLRVVPKIREKEGDCIALIDGIPEMAYGYQIISPERKEEYQTELQIRLDELLLPALEREKQKEQDEEIER